MGRGGRDGRGGEEQHRAGTTWSSRWRWGLHVPSHTSVRGSPSPAPREGEREASVQHGKHGPYPYHVGVEDELKGAMRPFQLHPHHIMAIDLR